MKRIISPSGRYRCRTWIIVFLLLTLGVVWNTRRAPLPASTSRAQHGKTLVTVMGRIRGDEKAWQSLYEHVLDVNGADLAVLTFEEIPPIYQNASLFTRAKYVWRIPDYEDWRKALDVMNGNTDSWREPLFDIYKNGNGGLNTILGGIGNIPGHGAIIFSFRYFLSQQLEKLLSQYDRFVVTRPDHFYLCQHDLRTLNPEYVWVPRGEDFQGITDRHVIASRHDILDVLNILPPVVKKPAAYVKQLSRPRYTPEKFLLHRWAEEGIQRRLRRFDRMMFVTVHPDESATDSKLVKEGVVMKYRSEYDASRMYCYFK
jgi:hypothetical protein